MRGACAGGAHRFLVGRGRRAKIPKPRRRLPGLGDRPYLADSCQRQLSPGLWGFCMKTLFLIRHAKSSWDDPALADKDRPLGPRGRRDAPKMGARLAKREVKPDLILSSPAARALCTAEIMAKKLDYHVRDIVVDERLYAAAADEVLSVIRTLDDKWRDVILFGHNPEFTELAHRLSRKITRMPTCAIAEFTFAVKSWSDVGR